MSEVWYRYTDHMVSAGVDEWGDSIGPGRVEVCLSKFRVLKHTTKGVWLDVYGQGRFVLNYSRKRYAHATVEEARESFIKRKERQIGIYSARIGQAEAAIRRVNGCLV